MKKTLILYFSRTGNNKFIAEKLSQTLESDIEAIKPKIKSFLLLILSSLFKLGIGIKPLTYDVKNYERIILLSPIWMGKLLSPIRGIIKKYGDEIKEIVFITVCGSGIEDKDGKFGYETVFKEIKNILPSKEIKCFEISTTLLTKIGNPQTYSLPLVSEKDFTGAFKSRFDEIVETLKN
ncbi:MAG: flavodoxin domain-containing protein [Exilispira sp.]|jgi:flavodoxin|nr:flavodoxin domain-containing protein [Exilispira sp.]